MQSAYQILVASSAERLARDEGDLWDSGRVPSDDSTNVSYAGQTLTTAQSVHWKVRVWDGAGRVSPWSAPATWTAGVFADSEWTARWIGAPAGLDAATLVLRKGFSVRPGLLRAVAFVCGLGQYEMFLNGRKVGDDLLTPGWSKYDRTCLYDTYDVTALLQAGANAAGLQLGNGMYNVLGGRYTKFKHSYGPEKALAQLRLEYADGHVETLGTDASWKVAAGPITFSCVYGGEDFDARLVQRGWQNANFNDSTWATAAVLDGPGGQLRGLSCAAPPIRPHEVLAPVKVTELRPGVTIYDLGQNASLMPHLQVRGVAGATVRIIPAELLTANGALDRASSGGGEAYWQYTLAGGAEGAAATENWFPQFYYHGCRYLEVDCTAAPGGALPVVEKLEGVVVHADCPAVGEFESSNDLFNRTFTLVRWAQRSNLMSVLTDCPHRERLGWLEQDYLNGPSLRYNFDVSHLMAKAMNDMADSQLDNGLVPDIAPEYTVFSGGFRDSPEWGSAVVQCAWQQYLWNGDTAVLARYYDAMKRYAGFLQGTLRDGLVSHGLGDWYDLGPRRPGQAQLTPVALTGTAIYYDDLQILENTARLLHKPDEAGEFAARAQQLQAAYTAAFFHDDTGQFATGSQTANAMSLALGLADPARAPEAVAALVADVRGRGNALTAGDVGYRYLLRALAEGGRSDVIFDMNNQSDRPGYGYQLKMGATSLTEAWDALRSSSQNHFMLGHIVEWFYHDLAGIQEDPAGPGFAKIILKPAPVGDLTRVRASYDSVRGRITSAWRRDGRQFAWDATIPANATATVYLPADAVANVRESGQPVAQSAGVKFLRMENGAAVFAVGSGSYAFTATLPAALN